MKLPEVYIDKLQQVIDSEDGMIFATCKFMADSWVEMGGVITKYLKAENEWTDKEAPRKAHAWFIESTAAIVGKHATSMYDRMRVGRNVVSRGWHNDVRFEGVKYGHWCALMRNIEHDGQLMVPTEKMMARVDWLLDTMEELGAVPSVRDINDEFRTNGETEEWELYWQSIIRNAKKLKAEGISNVPQRVSKIAEWLLSSANVDSTGGTNQGK